MREEWCAEAGCANGAREAGERAEGGVHFAVVRYER